MESLPQQSLPAVSHVIFGIFNLAIPDIIVWIIIIVAFILAIWLRLPKIFEGKEENKNESNSKNTRNHKR
jgi:uncharacterized membrane protein